MSGKGAAMRVAFESKLLICCACIKYRSIQNGRTECKQENESNLFRGKMIFDRRKIL